MDWQDLDAALNDFESLIHAGEGLRFDSFDSVLVWAKAAEIQKEFRRVRYPSKAGKDAAWARFNSLRDQASARSQAERDKRFYKSKQWRDMILSDGQSAHYSFFADHLIPPSIDVEGMKRMGETLRQAWRRFEEHKGEMIGEHKKECFDTLREAQESQDRWWADYKESAAERRREKINSTIEKLQEKLRDAYSTLEKMDIGADDLRDKIRNAWSDSYAERTTGWLAELEEKINRHKEHIERLEGWLREEQDKL
jgi:DNA mismatch repair ATPase MutS